MINRIWLQFENESNKYYVDNDFNIDFGTPGRNIKPVEVMRHGVLFADSAFFDGRTIIFSHIFEKRENYRTALNELRREFYDWISFPDIKILYLYRIIETLTGERTERIRVYPTPPGNEGYENETESKELTFKFYADAFFEDINTTEFSFPIVDTAINTISIQNDGEESPFIIEFTPFTAMTYFQISNGWKKGFTSVRSFEALKTIQINSCDGSVKIGGVAVEGFFTYGTFMTLEKGFNIFDVFANNGVFMIKYRKQYL